jgi:hypothetical protein
LSASPALRIFPVFEKHAPKVVHAEGSGQGLSHQEELLHIARDDAGCVRINSHFLGGGRLGEGAAQGAGDDLMRHVTYLVLDGHVEPEK